MGLRRSRDLRVHTETKVEPGDEATYNVYTHKFLYVITGTKFTKFKQLPQLVILLTCRYWVTLTKLLPVSPSLTCCEVEMVSLAEMARMECKDQGEREVCLEHRDPRDQGVLG